MNIQIGDKRLPAPSNIRISFPKMQGHLVVTWDAVRKPEGDDNLFYNIYRGISAGGIFYKQNPTPISYNIYQDRNIGKNPNTTYWYKISTVLVTTAGQVIEGPLSGPSQYRIATMNKWFNKVNERNLWILKNTGMLFDLYTRKYEGVRCPACYDSARGRAGNNGCTICFGTGFEGGYEPMMQLYLRLKPAEESLDISVEEYTYNSIPGAWTISPVQIKNRDVLIGPTGQMYSVVSSYVNQAAGYLFHQDLKLRALEPEDKMYHLRRATLKPGV